MIIIPIHKIKFIMRYMKNKNPMHHVKRCEGLPRQIPVGNWYHVGTYNLQQKDFCRVGMKKPNMFSSQSSSA